VRKLFTDIVSVLNKRERRRFYWLMAMNIFIVVSDLTLLAGLIYIVGIYGGSSDVSILPSALLDNNAILLLSSFFIVFLVKTLAAGWLIKKQSRFAYGVATRISANNAMGYYDCNYTQYTATPSSEFIQLISTQPMQFAQHLLLGMQDYINQLVLVSLVVTTVIIYNPAIFIFLLLFLLPPVTFMFFRLRAKAKNTRQNIVRYHQSSLQALYENLKGYVEANVYGRRQFFQKRFVDQQSKLNNHSADLLVLQQLPGRLIEACAVLGLLLLVIGVNYADKNNATFLTTIAAFMGASYKLIPGLVKLISLAAQIRNYHGVIVSRLLLATSPGQETRSNGISNIRYDNIGFKFNDHKVIQNASYQFNKGDFKGIKAYSGKGKTTMINLLLGFLPESEGTITYNDIPANPGERRSFWPSISYVKQENFLIADTILKNIVLSEDYDAKKLEQVVRDSGLQPVIDNLPDGIRHRLTENGKNLSGGQRQRIALARALYKDADVYILDESFSELDNASELKIIEHLKTLSDKGKIVILVTHSNTTLAQCREVIELH
jgi:ABC-type multidrug transport system fused ATPase/permease subunit